jgi:hypothetical protein
MGIPRGSTPSILDMFTWARSLFLGAGAFHVRAFFRVAKVASRMIDHDKKISRQALRAQEAGAKGEAGGRLNVSLFTRCRQVPSF